MSDLRNRFQKESPEELDLPQGHKERFLEKLGKGDKRKSIAVWQVAAGFIIVVASSLLYWNSKNSVQENTAVAEQHVEEQEEENGIPFDDATFYYKQTIDDQFVKLEEFYGDDDSKQLIEETKLLIAELQKEYEMLEEELERTGEEKIVIAMIGNYQKRIELLEELIQKLNYIKQLKSEQNEEGNQNA